MDSAKGLNSIVGILAAGQVIRKFAWSEPLLAKFSSGKVVGLLFGWLVVSIMIFMMFMILGGLVNGEQ